jgi:hypothetical protein
LGEVCQTLTVELVLEMLQSESVVEDISWWMTLAIFVSQARGSCDHTVSYGRCLSLFKRSDKRIETNTINIWYSYLSRLVLV